MTDEIQRLYDTLRQIKDLAHSADTDHLPIMHTCTPKSLNENLLIPSARKAVEINPSNTAPIQAIKGLVPQSQLSPAYIALVTAKRWPATGVRLTVNFLDNPAQNLKTRILSHMNAWNRTANVEFVESRTDPQVRITRDPDKGHWSYLGTDILLIPPDQATMNLAGFTMTTPESEYRRVVRHETGHTLGFPHEHLRRDLVEKIDVDKAIRFYGLTQSWSAEQVWAQVLTSIDEHSLLGTPQADEQSIMCYQIPSTVTRDGRPILGGTDINEQDYKYAGMWYPK